MFGTGCQANKAKGASAGSISGIIFHIRLVEGEGSGYDQNKRTSCVVQLLARLKPHLPVAQGWFRATAVGSDPNRKPQLPSDDSHDQAAVAATDYSCQVNLPLLQHEQAALMLTDMSPQSSLCQAINLLLLC